MPAERPLRILVEPTELRNVGDAAMVEVALARLRAFWPDAVFSYFCEPADPDVTALGMEPLPAEGRHLWFDEPLLPRPLQRLEAAVRQRWPGFANTLLQRRLRARGEARAAEAVRAFYDAVTGADVALACGMGGIADAFPDYARELLGTLELAAAHGARTVLVGQGIGPLDEPRLRVQAERVLPRADLIALRERRVGEPLLHSLGVRADRIMITGDDAIEPAWQRRAAVLGTGLGVNLRRAPYSGITDDVVCAVRAELRRFHAAHAAPLIALPISHAPADADADTIRLLLEGVLEASDGGRSADSSQKVIAEVARCRAVLTGSYHAAVFSLAMGIPAVGLVRSAYYESKFRGLADQFGAGCEVIDVTTAEWPARLGAALEDAWASAEAVRPQLLAAAAAQVERSRAAFRRIRDIVERERAA